MLRKINFANAIREEIRPVVEGILCHADSGSPRCSNIYCIGLNVYGENTSKVNASQLMKSNSKIHFQYDHPAAVEILFEEKILGAIDQCTFCLKGSGEKPEGINGGSSLSMLKNSYAPFLYNRAPNAKQR